MFSSAFVRGFIARGRAGVVGLAVAGVLFSGAAQAVKHPWEDYDKRLDASHSPAALGSDLFGDSVNLQDGALSFSVADVSIPGNSGLPVAFSRSGLLPVSWTPLWVSALLRTLNFLQLRREPMRAP